MVNQNIIKIATGKIVPFVNSLVTKYRVNCVLNNIFKWYVPIVYAKHGWLL